ncbi:MAG: ABC-2 transporter permease [Defluviitaleaceae bacterium]|nr:ABC-2 transporter permease [Defluviitaleaceae bacterium]
MLNMLRLDYFNVKNQVNLRMIVLYAALVAFAYSAMGVYGVAFALLPISSLLIIEPFSAGQNGLDKLYSTLPISRNQVVYSRYLYALTIYLGLIVFFLLVGIILGTVLEDNINLADFVPILAGMFLISALVAFAIYPITFKHGYKKARVLAMFVPIFGPMAIFAILNLQGIEIDITQISAAAFVGVSAVHFVLFATVWLLLLGCSIKFSCKLYRQRDF